MPGGAAAIREPWRMAAAWLGAAFGERVPVPLAVVGRNLDHWEQVAALARSSAASVATSSAGRLFDAVSAILGVRDAVNYEARRRWSWNQLADPAEAAAYRPGSGAPPTTARRCWSAGATSSARWSRTWTQACPPR